MLRNDRHWTVSGGKQVNLLPRGQGHGWQEGRIQTAGSLPAGDEEVTGEAGPRALLIAAVSCSK